MRGGLRDTLLAALLASLRRMTGGLPWLTGDVPLVIP